MAPHAPDAFTIALDWSLAAAALVFWLASYGVVLVRERAFRRWWSHLWAQIVFRFHDIVRHRHRPQHHPDVRPLFPAAGRRPPQPIQPAATTQAIRTTSQTRPAPRIARWSVDHLPLRYRLLGLPRRPANDD